MASNRTIRHRKAFAAMTDRDLSDMMEVLEVLRNDARARDDWRFAIVAGILQAEFRNRVRWGFKPRTIEND